MLGTEREFPVEIVTQIVDAAYDDAEVSTMKAASLVCRQWNAIARPYVFRRVTIFTEASLDRLHLFLSTDQTVLPLIHTLVICSRREDDLMTPSAWIGRVSSILSPLLTKLETIELARFYEDGEHINAAFVESFANFSSVHTLTFRNSSIDTTLIQALVSALPGLQNLVIFHVSPLSLQVTTDLPQLRSPRLVSMELQFTYAYLHAMDTFLPWVAASETRETLRSLSATVRLQGGAAFGQFIRAVGSKIENLKLDLDVYYGLPGEIDSIKQKFDIRSCVNLRSLEVYYENTMAPAVIALLEEVKSPHFSIIVLSMSTGLASVGDLPSLAPLDEAFSASALKAVKAIDVRYSGMLDLHVVREKVQRELPTTYTRGLVRVVSWD